MKEENTRKLLEEGLIHTSDDFTDRLMRRVEKESVPVGIPVWQHVLFFGSLLVLLAWLLLLLFKGPLSLPMLEFPLPPLPLQLAGIFFVLFALNKFLLLKEASGRKEPKKE